jgi:hypothetical protein
LRIRVERGAGWKVDACGKGRRGEKVRAKEGEEETFLAFELKHLFSVCVLSV